MAIIYAGKPRRGIHFAAHMERGVFFRKKKTNYVGPGAVIERGAVIEPGVQIGANAFIGRGVVLGAGAVVHPSAHIENATLGADCVVYSGAVIGKDGFGFTRQNGRNEFLPHAGRVNLGARVSVGANTCIDRGLMSDTVVGEGTKIDNLCQIAHGVIIGRECFIASGTGMAGGVVVGDRAMIGGHVGISNKVKVGDDVEIGANSGVFRDIPAGRKMLGYPATGAFEYMRMFAWTKRQVEKNDAKK
jgi:UDP-3-O-[3-hydroxymyristoyl] glucosamine N-acyltransferase